MQAGKFKNKSINKKYINKYECFTFWINEDTPKIIKQF